MNSWKKDIKIREIAGSDTDSKGNSTSAGRSFERKFRDFRLQISGHLLAYLLIGLVNLVGFVIIAKILEKELNRKELKNVKKEIQDLTKKSYTFPDASLNVTSTSST